MSDSFPIDDFLSSPQLSSDPGSRVYLYRLLRTLLSGETTELAGSAQAYQTARKLAQRLVVDTPEQLESLVADLGVGELKLTVSRDSMAAVLSRKGRQPSAAAGEEAISCEFERGLIDGSLELIAGLPVETLETSCSNRGDEHCIFEAVREEFKGMTRFAPGSLDASSASKPKVAGLSENLHNSGRLKIRREFGPPLSRSWFLDLAARELARSRRHGRPLTLLYLDIDDLGQINAAHGRTAGDRLIYIVATALSSNCRAEDFLWYPGEDEFAVVLAETSLDEGEAVARRLIENMQTRMNRPNVESGATVSIGCSAFPDNADSVNDLYAAAKAALYQAKSQGKNCAAAAMAIQKNEVEPVSDGAAKQFGGNGAEPSRDRSAKWLGESAKAAGSSEDEPAAEDAGLEQEDSFTAATATESEVVEEVTPSTPEAEGTVETAASVETVATPEAPAGDLFPESETDEGRVIAGPEMPEAEQGQASPERASPERASPERATENVAAVIATVKPLLMAGMSQIIADEEGMNVLREVEEPAGLAAIIMESRPDLLITDLSSVALNDFELIRQIRSENIPCKVAVMVSAIDQDVVKLAAEMMVEAVIFQDASPDEIVAVLWSVSRSETVYPEEVQAAIDEILDTKRMLGDLSEREQQVLKLMAEGKTNQQISEELYITVNTVRFHLANIYQKLGVSNRTEAANYYLRQGISPDTPPTDISSAGSA